MLSRIYLFFDRFGPGTIACIGLSLVAIALERTEAYLFQHAWIESLVIAILLGTLIRTFLPIPERFLEGIGFSGKTLLEVAVMLLGATISAQALIHAGFFLIAGIAATVFIVIAISYSIGRLLKLSHKMSILVACGNSICGNSAIAAAAPVIGAKGEDIASSIAFTAVLGVIVILILPFSVPLFGLSDSHYGILAGMTVYAVPQVLAATAPISQISVQIGTLVKLVRVLMLGPVILILSLMNGKTSQTKLPFRKIVPWFIIGFLALMACRSLGLIPEMALKPVAATANILTIISMAALGLGVNIRSIAKAGIRVTLTATLSIICLAAISLSLIAILHP